MNQLIVAEKKKDILSLPFFLAQFVERRSVEQAAGPREATRDCRATVLGRIVAALETQHNGIRGFWGRQSRRRGVGKDGDSAQPVLGKR